MVGDKYIRSECQECAYDIVVFQELHLEGKRAGEEIGRDVVYFPQDIEDFWRKKQDNKQETYRLQSENQRVYQENGLNRNHSAEISQVEKDNLDLLRTITRPSGIFPVVLNVWTGFPEHFVKASKRVRLLCQVSFINVDICEEKSGEIRVVGGGRWVLPQVV